MISTASPVPSAPSDLDEDEFPRDPETGRVLCITELTEEQLLAELEYALTHPSVAPEMPPGYYKDLSMMTP